MSLEVTNDDSSKNKYSGQSKEPGYEESGELILAGCLPDQIDSKDVDLETYKQTKNTLNVNPLSFDSWMEMIDSYQQKYDIDGAIECLEEASKYCDTDDGAKYKLILRKHSILMRQKNHDSIEEKIAALLKSLELSKEALKLDLFDEENYYNLAKAYMCLFFVTECVDQRLINLSKAAYLKALKLSQENYSKNDQQSSNCTKDSKRPLLKQSDFFFNFATVLIYLQEFQETLIYLKTAITLDQDWDEPKVLKECLIDYLKQTHLMIRDVGKNNKKLVKRYCKIVEPLKNVDRVVMAIKLDQQRLHKSMQLEVKSITLDELEQLSSTDKKRVENSEESAISNNMVSLLHLKLIGTIHYNQAMYLTFIAIDQNYSLIVLTIYNLADSKCPSTRDVVTIVEPKLELISVEGGSIENLGSISYKRINVREFKSLYLNGHRISTEQVSKPQFKVSLLPG